MGLNLGVYDHYIEKYLMAPPLQLTLPDVSPNDSSAERVFFQLPRAGIEIRCDSIRTADSLLVSIRAACNYRVDFFHGKQLADSVKLDGTPTGHIQSIDDLRILLPLAIRERGFDRIHIRPAGGDGFYKAGQISFVTGSGQ